MKRSTFIVLFAGVNVLFVFLQIDKNSKITDLSYQNQRKQREIDLLLHQKESLTNQLEALKNPAAVKEYASEQLHMKKIKLSQIKLMTNQDNTCHE